MSPLYAARDEADRINRAADEGVPLVDERGESINLDDLVANMPPVEAYEEMPRLTGTIGNINLGRLGRPQEVAQLIRQVSQRVGGFSAAARGRITHNETQRLARELGVKPEQLLKRRQGQALNAEELYASRALVQRSRETVARLARKAVSGDDDSKLAFRKAWLAHVALEEQIAGATAEAGRALSQMRMLARAQDAGANAVSAYLRGIGGKERLDEAAEAIVDLMEDPDRRGPGLDLEDRCRSPEGDWRQARRGSPHPDAGADRCRRVLENAAQQRRASPARLSQGDARNGRWRWLPRSL